MPKFQSNYWRAHRCEIRKSIIRTIKQHNYGNRPPVRKQITPPVARRIMQVPLRRK
jgi:hypothetical protein